MKNDKCENLPRLDTSKKYWVTENERVISCIRVEPLDALINVSSATFVDGKIIENSGRNFPLSEAKHVVVEHFKPVDSNEYHRVLSLISDTSGFREA